MRLGEAFFLMLRSSSFLKPLRTTILRFYTVLGNTTLLKDLSGLKRLGWKTKAVFGLLTMLGILKLILETLLVF